MSNPKPHQLEMNGYAFKVPEPFKRYRFTHVVVKSRVPSCIVGVAVGNQVTKSRVKVRSDPITEENACIKKSVKSPTVACDTEQASLTEENNYLEKIKTLEQENLQLKVTLKEKDSTISRLMKIIEDQAAEYNTAIELGKKHQNETERRLEKSENLVKEKTQLLDETISQNTKIIEECHNQHAEVVFEMKMQNEADIRCREEKIVKLKQYISDTFQEKSREHQQQIDELRREINKYTEEVCALKAKLEKEIRSKKDCEHCKHQES